MLPTRLVIGLSLVAFFLVVLCLDEFLAPWFPLWFLTILIAVYAGAQELIGLLEHTPIKPARTAVYGGLMVLLVSHWAPHIVNEVERWAAAPGVNIPHDPLAGVHVMAWPLWAFVSVVMVSFMGQAIRFKPGGTAMATMGGTVLTLTYIGLLGGFIIQMRWLEGGHHGLLPLACLVAASKGADTGAYTMGRIAGRHKLWPQLSPNKTIEGAIGGTLGGVGFVAIVTAVCRYLLKMPTLSWPAAIGFGVLVSTAAQLGDLMESMIKRDCAQKDAGTNVPGFGGVLDVIDSLLFAAPVAYGYWVWLGP